MPSLGGEASWLMRAKAGMPLYPWQDDMLTQACQVDSRDRLTIPEVTLICPRRNGKTQAVIARMLADCLLWSTPANPTTILYTAHLGSTVRKGTFTPLKELIKASPWLNGHVLDVMNGKGEEAILFKNGSRIDFLARTLGGGRGMECTTLVLDEAMRLREDHLGPLLPLVAKGLSMGLGQVWWVSSAGDGTSIPLIRQRDNARAGHDPSGLFLEWAAPRDADPTDPITWAQANPSLGQPILQESFLQSMARQMSPEDFGREHLGWWTDQTADPFLPHGSWQACAADPPPLPPTARVAFGLEVQDNGRAGALVAAVDLGETVWVETLRRWWEPGGLDPATLAAAVAGEASDKRALVVAGDQLTTGIYLDHLAAARVPIARLNFAEVRQASQALLSAVTSGRLAHPTEPLTDAELINVGKSPTGDGLEKLSRTRSTGASTAAFAAAAAVAQVTAPLRSAPLLMV